jgi:uncharacterized repeat protein (TIGR01451 family)
MALPLRHQPAWLIRSLLIFAVLLVLTGQTADAQSGADLEARIDGKRAVRLGNTITYTITGTNVGDATATGVQLMGWVPDWFNFVSVDCLGGVPGEIWGCAYPDLAPGERVQMTITVEACCPEPHMFELGWASATNDVNVENNEDRIKVVFTGPKR